MLTKKERLNRQLEGKEVDHIPTMGGWFASAGHLLDIGGMSWEEYQADPEAGTVKAYKALDVDCLATKPAIPRERDQVRGIAVLDENFKDVTPEDVKKDGDEVPDDDEIVAAFDVPYIEDAFRFRFEKWTDLLEDIQIVPMFWEGVPQFQLWSEYGYEAYFMASALYPEAVGNLYRRTGIIARERNRIFAKLMKEYDIPPLVYEGYDICDQRGPMFSVDFMRKYYFPWVKHALEPYFEADIEVVRHCDGNVGPFLDDFIDIGYAGLQGFQFETGLDLYDIVDRFKKKTGKAPIIFGGVSVTRTLPFGTPEDVREEIEYFIDATNGGKRLIFFSSNTIGREVPLENVTFGYDYIVRGGYAQKWTGPTHETWPWNNGKES